MQGLVLHPPWAKLSQRVHTWLLDASASSLPKVLTGMDTHRAEVLPVQGSVDSYSSGD